MSVSKKQLVLREAVTCPVWRCGRRRVDLTIVFDVLVGEGHLPTSTTASRHIMTSDKMRGKRLVQNLKAEQGRICM